MVTAREENDQYCVAMCPATRTAAILTQLVKLLLLLLLPMYWFKCDCHANDAGAIYNLQSHNNSEEGSKKLAKTEPKQMCLQLLPKGSEG